MDYIFIIIFISCCCYCCLILSGGSFYYMNSNQSTLTSNKSTTSTTDITTKSNINSEFVSTLKITHRGQICREILDKYPNILYFTDSIPINSINTFTINKCSDYFFYGDK